MTGMEWRISTISSQRGANQEASSFESWALPALQCLCVRKVLWLLAFPFKSTSMERPPSVSCVFAPPSLYQAIADIAVTLWRGCRCQAEWSAEWAPTSSSAACHSLSDLTKERYGKIASLFSSLFILFPLFKRFKSEVICIGNEQFCLELILIHLVLFFDATQWQSLKAFKAVNTNRRGLDCIDASQKVGEAMARCDFLLIPVLSTTNGRPLGDLGHPRLVEISTVITSIRIQVWTITWYNYIIYNHIYI